MFEGTWFRFVPRLAAALAVILVVETCVPPVSAQAPAAAGAKINLVIVEGDGAVNNIRQRVSREPIVQVEDDNHKPIAGAIVTFFLPDQGAGGTFSNGSHSLTVMTDSQGRAVASGIRMNNVAGKIQIRVTASYRGQTANATINQTSMAVAAAAISAKLLIILLLAGAGVAGGVIAATRGGGGGMSATPAASPTIITAGTPTVGGPQ